MTTVLIERQAPNRLLTDDEVDELCALTAHLPLLLRGGWTTPTPLGLSEGALRLDAAMWEVAYRHGVDVGATCNVLDVVDKLSAQGWSTGPARDALRAFVMLHWSRGADELAACRAAGRLTAYLELRARYG